MGRDGVDGARLWAKTEPGGNGWHALPCHLLDVAATAERLWDALPASARAVPMRLWTDAETCRKAVVFLAAAHDVGKANPCFQAKNAQQATRLKDLGFTLRNDEPCGHGYATGVFLKDWLKDRWGWSPPAAANVARAVGGHHGSFYQETKLTELHQDREPWKAIGPEMLDELAAVLGSSARIEEPKDLNPLLGWLAGFVCVADWLGSHDGMVRDYREDPGDLGAYLEEARANARTLFDALKWPSATSSAARLLKDLVPEGREPNGVQRLAERVAAEGFGLAIVEAPTGEGKTEAAFALAEPLRAEGAGVCFLLPTMATANGLYERVKSYLKSDVRLAHSQAWLYRDEGIVADDEMAAEGEDWFVGAKRALLAPYGVGTIDQGLMGALRVRHGFVRLFALAGKTVVVDEVHAYDVYMSDLLEVLLGWLRALGCRVVLLSATLPSSRRAALLAAWGAPPVEAAPYPCLTWTDANGRPDSKTFEVAERKPLELRLLEREHEEAWAQGAARILERMREGRGTGALVLNTVDAAQKAYEWLKANAGPEIGLTIFHARYTAQDRSRKEKKVLKRFGKAQRRRRPALLVATQVVEQSLDLDFDHMVSSLAPIDLLIQRAGRLHRHPRRKDGSLCPPGENDARHQPMLEVLRPKEQDGAPVFDDPVYARDVLMRTLDALERGVRIDEPVDVATHVEAIYGDLDPKEAQDAWLARYAEASDREDLKRERMSDYAKWVVIPKANGRVPLTDRKATTVEDDSPESDVAAKTRLEDLPSVTLAILRSGDPEPGKVPSAKAKEAIALRCVRVAAGGKRYKELVGIKRATGWGKVKALREARPVELDEEGRFETPSYVYTYDVEVGLKWEPRDA